MSNQSSMEPPVQQNPFAPELFGAEQLNAEPADFPAAPRRVGFPVTLSLLLNSTLSATVGWIFLCFFGLFFLIFFGVGGLGAAIYESCGIWEPYGRGTIVSCESAGVSVNDSQVQRITFEVTSPNDGSAATGVSYSFHAFGAGSDAVVERRVGTKDVLRVQGASIAKFGSLGGQIIPFIALSIFCLLGLALAVVAPVRKGLRLNKLLKKGTAIRSAVVNTGDAGKRVNGKPVVYALYQGTAESGAAISAKVETLDPDKIANAPFEVLFYDPENEKRTALLSDLPANVVYDPNEGFRANLLKLTPKFIFIMIFIAEIAVMAYLSCQIPHATFFIE